MTIFVSLMKNGKKIVVFSITAILILVLSVASIWIYGKLTQEEEDPGTGGCPARILGVGEKEESWYGKVKYVGYENKRIELKITNTGEEGEMYVYLYGYADLPLTEKGGGQNLPVTITNNEEYIDGGSITVNEGIHIYINGELSEEFLIPMDGKEYEVIIDFNEVYSAYDNVWLNTFMDVGYFTSFGWNEMSHETKRSRATGSSSGKK